MGKPHTDTRMHNSVLGFVAKPRGVALLSGEVNLLLYDMSRISWGTKWICIPGVWKLQAYHIEHSVSVGAVIVLYKIPKFHLQVRLTYHVNHINFFIASYNKTKHTSNISWNVHISLSDIIALDWIRLVTNAVLNIGHSERRRRQTHA